MYEYYFFFSCKKQISCILIKIKNKRILFLLFKKNKGKFKKQ